MLQDSGARDVIIQRGPEHICAVTRLSDVMYHISYFPNDPSKGAQADFTVAVVFQLACTILFKVMFGYLIAFRDRLVGKSAYDLVSCGPGLSKVCILRSRHMAGCMAA